MPRFAAHLIMYFKRKQGPQAQFTAWENVHLIEAPDPDDAWAQAERIGHSIEGDDATLREVGPDGDHPSTCVFAGVRKVLTVSHERWGAINLRAVMRSPFRSSSSRARKRSDNWPRANQLS